MPLPGAAVAGAARTATAAVTSSASTRRTLNDTPLASGGTRAPGSATMINDVGLVWFRRTPEDPCLEPAVRHLHGRPVQARQQVEHRTGLGQLVAEEVRRRGPLAVVEVALLALGGEELLEPDPGEHHVPDRLEVDRRVGQRRLRVARGPQLTCDGDQPVHGALQLAGELAALAAVPSLRCCFDGFGEELEPGAALHDDLAAEQ